MARLRAADWMAGLAALAVLGLMFAPWLGAASGWSSLGWAGDLIVALAIAGGAGIWLTIAQDRAPAVQIVTAAEATTAALVAALIAVIEVVFGDDRRTTGWLGLAALVALAVACWRSMADERTDVAAGAYTPPPARPAPPA